MPFAIVLSALALFSFRAIAVDETSCEIQIASCPFSPGLAGKFKNDFQGADKDSARCLRRATEYSSWCQTAEPVTAKFLSGSLVVAEYTSPYCFVSVPSCPRFPTMSSPIFDNYEDSKWNQNRCLNRANDYANYCQSEQLVKSTYFDNRIVKSERSVEPGRCEIEIQSCPKHPQVIGNITDDFENSGKDETRCLARARDYGLWCESPDPVTARYIFAFKMKSEKTWSPDVQYCQLTVPECPLYPAAVGQFKDQDNNAMDSAPKCFQRATDYKNWCNATEPVYAEFYSKDKNKLSTHTNSCDIILSDCPRSPGLRGRIFDNHENSREDATRCSKRAIEYASWCQTSSPVLAWWQNESQVNRMAWVTSGISGYRTHDNLLDRNPRAVQKIYVHSSLGHDFNSGSVNQPLKSLERAQAVARSLVAGGPVEVNLNGIFHRKTPWILTAQDNTSENEIWFRSEPGTQAEIRGSEPRLLSWKKESAVSNLFSASASDLTPGQIFLNSSKLPILQSSPLTETARFTDSQTINCEKCGLNLPKDKRKVWALLQIQWQMAVCVGILDAQAQIQLGTCAPLINWLNTQHLEKHNQPARLSRILGDPWNSESDEGYAFDGQKIFVKTKQLDPMTASVRQGVSSQLLQLVQARNMRFTDISFVETTWDQPFSEIGYRTEQGDVYFPDYKMIPASVECLGCKNVIFDSNRWKNLGGAGVLVSDGSQDTAIFNNRFESIGASAIQIAGSSLRPFDQAETKNTWVVNNQVDRAGDFFSSSVGLFQIFGQGSVIYRNSFQNLPYSGVSVGWGWTLAPQANLKNNLILQNKIDQFMTVLQDGGGIYTLSRQPGTQIRENWISNGAAGLPGLNHINHNSNGIYLDNGSAEILVEKNLVQRVPQKEIFENKDPAPAQENTILPNVSWPIRIERSAGYQDPSGM